MVYGNRFCVVLSFSNMLLLVRYLQFCVSEPVGFAERRFGHSQSRFHMSLTQQQDLLA